MPPCGGTFVESLGVAEAATVFVMTSVTVWTTADEAMADGSCRRRAKLGEG
jgi:hypothetical protein